MTLPPAPFSAARFTFSLRDTSDSDRRSGLSLLAAACGGEPDLGPGNLPAAARGLASVVGAPHAREGGVARLYRVPRSTPSAWKARTSCPPLERIVGADAEQGVVFVLDKQAQRRRARPRDPPGPHLSSSRCATRHVGPDGALYAVDTGEHRDADGPPRAGAVPLQAAGRAAGAARDHDRSTARPRGRDKAPVLEVLGSDQAAGLHDAAVGRPSPRASMAIWWPWRPTPRS